MENKKYALVAWTRNGQICMIPSLVNELSVPYREHIAEVEKHYPDKDKEVLWLKAQSRAHEDFARFLLRVGRPAEAFQEFENAAIVCTFCTENAWVEGEECEKEMLPLMFRFVAMHLECVRLMKDNRLLRLMYEHSLLSRLYSSFSRYDGTQSA